MGRKRKHVDYRQLYKDHYGIDFGPDMAIHHIDFDRENNDIDNLLLMPNELHAKYHFAFQMLTGIDMSKSLNEELRLSGPMVPSHFNKWLRYMADVLHDVGPWLRMKQDFEKYPREIFQVAYHTDQPITERSVE